MHELCAYINIEGAIIPLPYYHVLDLHELTVLADGQEWVKTKYDNLSRARPSPDRQRIVLEHWLQGGPIRILHLEMRQIIELNAENPRDEFPGHYNVYPFRFVRWDTDDTFLVEVNGHVWDSSTEYPQVWRVDARTGARSRIE